MQDINQTKEPRLRYWVNRAYTIPVAGYLLRIATAIWNLPIIIKNLSAHQATTEERLTGKADRETVEELQRVLKETVAGESAQEAHRREAIYMSFEERFRGTPEEIKRKLSLYLPAIAEIVSAKGGVSLLDLGCGRGEWLELLKEKGYSAKGVDISKMAIEHCREQGLDVAEADVIEYLRGIERNSLDAITGFHLIEHLPFNILIALFDEALAVLKSGGMIILETPNPTNILVSAYDFYRDPGHLRPLHPDTVQLMAEHCGFVRACSYFVGGGDWDKGNSSVSFIKSTDWKLDDIQDYVRAPRDFALIAYRP